MKRSLLCELFLFAGALIAFGGCSRQHSRDLSEARLQSDSYKTAGPQQLTPDGQAELRQYIGTAQLPDLRFPSFKGYQSEVQEFYDGFGYALPWIRAGKPTEQARKLIEALKDAEYKGLRPEDYDGPRWDARAEQLSTESSVPEQDLLRFDLALTVSAMRYLSNLHAGRVNPRAMDFDIEIHRTKFDLSEFLAKEVVDAQDVEASLASVEPPFPVYQRTEAALKKYIELARQDDGRPLPVPLRPVKPGDSYSGIPRLAKVLALLGDISGETSQTSSVYQGTLVEGVRHFQSRHGLDPTGVIDRPTLRELNTPLAQRVTQLKFTLERIRWLPHAYPRPPVVVNIPEFRLHADDEGYHWAFSMKVVVGRAYDRQTPVFTSVIDSVIFRPYWDVPSSILTEELLPHLDEDPLYLAEHSYEMVDKGGSVVAADVADEKTKAQLRDGSLRVRQIPGPDNALGLLKFNIPSPYDVYMHGTPATDLFSRSRRDFSHGCIRVEDPVKLAEWVLHGEPEGWDQEKIRAAMDGDATLRVKLSTPIPVLIFYSTAVVMEDGEVHFFDDIYGHDEALQRTLDQGYPYLPLPRKPRKR